MFREVLLLGRRSGLALAGLALVQAGCVLGPDAQPEEEAGPAPAVETEARQATLLKELTGVTSRSDVSATITLPVGMTGTFSAFRYCPPGTFAVGYHQQVLPYQGSVDDTGVNAIELECMDPEGNVFSAQAGLGAAGVWYPGAICPRGMPVRGASVRLVPTGGLDAHLRCGRATCAENVGFLDARLTCSDGSRIQAKGGWTATGANYTTDALCAAGTSVCGISVKPGSTGLDKTGMGGVKLACCPNPSAAYSVHVTERTLDGIHARTFTKETGAPSAPLVLVEGFDIDGDYTVDAIPLLIAYKTDTTLLGKLLSLGYTVTFVDLTKNHENIAKNARRVGALVEQLWNESQRIRPIKLVGASMGGLVVATAAAMRSGWAEIGEANPGWTFQVDHVTTMDSPHGGVYIPQAIFHLASRFQDHKAAAKDLLNKIRSPAAMEMMYIPYDATFETAHATWQRYYDRVLNYLRRSDIRLVSVVNGSWNGAPQYASWVSGRLNIKYSDDGYLTDAFAWLYTQPASPSGLVAQINTSGLGVTDENKSYYTYGNYPVVENLPGGYTDHWKALYEVIKSKATAPVYERHSFVPTWSSAGIPYDVWRHLPVEQQTDLGLLEAVRGPLAGSALSPFDKILRTNANNLHPFVPPALSTAFVEEMKAALAIPAPQVTWTRWLNRDTPFDGNGDGEHRALFSAADVPCQAPLTAECRRVHDGVDWTRTGDVVRCSTAGAECLNAEQPEGLCGDYEVRFACPLPSIVGPWLNRDTPFGNGDGEHHGLLVTEYGACAQPIGIECQTVAGVDVTATGEMVRCQHNLGLECLNANQSDGMCEDYQVRFACPTAGVWTPWLNGDLPDGTGDGEQLVRHVASGAACPRPLAAECRRRSDGLDWKLVGQNMICNAVEGGFCRNDRNGGWCEDYEIRFFCPSSLWPKP